MDIKAALSPAEAAALANGQPAGADGVYLQTIGEFITEEDPPQAFIFPGLLPVGVLMLIHGEPRARKSLAAFELAMAASTGTAPFGLERFKPVDGAPVVTLYIQEEDPRSLTRPRLRRLVTERCGNAPPNTTLHVAVRRGVNLDDPLWVERLIEDMTRLGVKLLILDAARRLSSKTDEGPSKMHELTGVLRSIVTRTGAAVAIVHHDVKPPANGQDSRRRGHRASGADWYAAAECPVHVERVSGSETLVFPEDYKFSADPAPFTFRVVIDGPLIKALSGTNITTDQAEAAGLHGKVIEWVRVHGPASKSAMQRAGLARWEALAPAIEALCKQGKLDSTPGRQKGSALYFIPGAGPTTPPAPAPTTTQIADDDDEPGADDPPF